jgi:hypothetical protein
MTLPDESRLIFDWATFGERRRAWPERVMLHDETLRDGLQSPVGHRPASGQESPAPPHDGGLRDRQRQRRAPRRRGARRAGDVRLCARDRRRPPPHPGRLRRPHDGADIADRGGRAAGRASRSRRSSSSAPPRQAVRRGVDDRVRMLKQPRRGRGLRGGEGLDVMYVTEDTVSADPDDLKVLLTAAIRRCDAGLPGDTVGPPRLTGAATRRFVRAIVDSLGESTSDRLARPPRPRPRPPEQLAAIEGGAPHSRDGDRGRGAHAATRRWTSSS